MFTLHARSTIDLLAAYARTHRDQRNIATHVVGVPMVIFGLGVLLGRPSWAGGWSPAWVLWGLSSLWYLSRGTFWLGLGVVGLNMALVALAAPLAAGSTPLWLGCAALALSLGWTLQMAGHYYEGRRASWMDDAASLLIGPLFVVAEWQFGAGRLSSLRQELERRVGPTHLRDLTVPAS